MDITITDTGLFLKDLELESVHYAIGGRLMVKKLPSFPPVDCIQVVGECFEMAEHVVVLLKDGDPDILVTTVCSHHLAKLLTTEQLLVPLEITN